MLGDPSPLSPRAEPGLLHFSQQEHLSSHSQSLVKVPQTGKYENMTTSDKPHDLSQMHFQEKCCRCSSEKKKITTKRLGDQLCKWTLREHLIYYSVIQKEEIWLDCPIINLLKIQLYIYIYIYRYIYNFFKSEQKNRLLWNAWKSHDFSIHQILIKPTQWQAGGTEVTGTSVLYSRAI